MLNCLVYLFQQVKEYSNSSNIQEGIEKNSNETNYTLEQELNKFYQLYDLEIEEQLTSKMKSHRDKDVPDFEASNPNQIQDTLR